MHDRATEPEEVQSLFGWAGSAVACRELKTISILGNGYFFQSSTWSHLLEFLELVRGRKFEQTTFVRILNKVNKLVIPNILGSLSKNKRTN